MVKKSGLGKSFGSLLPENFDNSILLDKKDRVQKINISELSADTSQPRKHFDQEKLKELSISIKNHGILQPLVVRAHAGRYVIIAGERRFKAAKLAGLKQIPALVRSSQELERLEIGLVENVQRVDLSPIEQAISIAKLNGQFNLSIEEISKKLGKAKTTIINIVRLLKLPPQALNALEQNKISEGHARTILSLEAHPKKQAELLANITAKHWSVRRSEQYAKAVKEARPAAAGRNMAARHLPFKLLSAKLNAKVTIYKKKQGGEIKIKFKNEDDYKRIIDLLS